MAVAAEIQFDDDDLANAEQQEKHCVGIVTFDPRSRVFHWATGRLDPVDAKRLKELMKTGLAFGGR